jgi:hypothetical protein
MAEGRVNLDQAGSAVATKKSVGSESGGDFQTVPSSTIVDTTNQGAVGIKEHSWVL